MVDIAVILPDEPDQALEKINNHNHDGGLGTKIPTDGLEDNAVTEPKLANQAVSTRTIEDNAVGRDQLSEEVNEMLSTGASEGVPGLTNYIANGLAITPGSGMSVNVSSGRASIAEKTVSLATPETIAMDVRMASLIYAQKITDSDIPVIGKINAAYWEPDDNTVAQWRFNLNGDVDVPNYAVGRSAIAVANNLVHNGGLTRVDGWCDYSVKGDGNTGYYVSQNSTGFPAGSAEREVVFLYSPIKISAGNQTIFHTGAGASEGTQFVINQEGTRLKFYTYTTSYDTGFDVEVGKYYLVSVGYVNGNIMVYINGTLIYKQAMSLNTGMITLNLLRNSNAVQYTNGIICCFEIRNKMRTPAQIGAIANNLLLPCFYTASTGKSYPVLSASDLASAYHEWKFDETTGTTVADSKGTMNGTATGAIIVDSPLGLGEARFFSATITDAINCGNYSFPAEYTAVFIIKPVVTGRSIIGNYNGTAGNAIQSDTDMTIKIYSSANTPITAKSKSTLNIGQYNFAAVSVGGGIADIYVNSSNIDVSHPWIPNTALSSSLQIGNNGISTDSINGVIDYGLIIPRYLAPAEISVIYNSLMGVVGDKDIRSILPANAISIGRVRSDSDSVTEISGIYAVGRREGAMAGNRKQFLGWKYFNTGGVTAVPLYWQNPFGTAKIKRYFVSAQDASGLNESVVTPSFYDYTVTKYGGLEVMYNNPSLDIFAKVREIGIATTSGYKQSGYIGCYAEVLTDD